MQLSDDAVVRDVGHRATFDNRIRDLVSTFSIHAELMRPGIEADDSVSDARNTDARRGLHP
jgi:hypothetical protein